MTNRHASLYHTETNQPAGKVPEAGAYHPMSKPTTASK